jgi:hypothetical protein
MLSLPQLALPAAKCILMAGHKLPLQTMVEEGEPHDCWTTTEAALTRHLSDDLREAWERLRETAAAFGEQRIYASHHSIMFSRKTCYFFVRPKQKYLEPMCLPGTEARSSPGAARKSGFEIQTVPPDPNHTSGRGRASDPRLASGSVHALERTLKPGCLDDSRRADRGTKVQEHSAAK